MTDREMILEWLDKCDGICNENTFCTKCQFVADPDCREKIISAIKRELMKEEVVRCKDCIHLPHYDDEGKLQFPWDSPCPCVCSDTYYAWRPADDWFCANGERKEAQEDASD